MTIESTLNELVPGSAKAVMGTVGAASGDLWMVPIDAINTIEGFNVRQDNDDYRAHVAWLAEQIKQHGFRRDKPLTGYVSKEHGQNFIYITDGHTRLAAAHNAIAAGAQISQLPVVITPKGTNAEDLVIGLVTSNSGKPLSPYEVALVCKRLLTMGLDEATIAERLSYTPQHIKSLLTVTAANKTVRDMVSSGKVSATLAAAVIKKNGKDAAAVLKKGLDEAQAKGKKKVTAKHVAPAPAAKKTTKKGKAAPAPAPAGCVELIRRCKALLEMVAFENKEDIAMAQTLLADVTAFIDAEDEL